MITPIHDRLILRPSDSLMRGSIFIPETYTDASTSCKVISKGSKVSPLININDTVLCEVGFGDRKAGFFEGTRDFWCKEENIYAIIRNRTIYPLGRKILIRRDIADSHHGEVLRPDGTLGTIVIPANRRYQSHLGTVERIGITRSPLRVNGIKVGDSIRLVEWMEHYTEIELENGGYGLIVNDTDLLYKTLPEEN